MRRPIRNAMIGSSCVFVSIFTLGCEIVTRGVPETAQVEEAQPAAYVQQPTTYIVEAGYPPGSYYYGDYVVWGGRYYDKTVFKETIVNTNIRNNVYTNVQSNRTAVNKLPTSHITPTGKPTGSSSTLALNSSNGKSPSAKQPQPRKPTTPTASSSQKPAPVKVKHGKSY